MEELSLASSKLASLILAYIDRPVLIVNQKNLKVISLNSQAQKLFKLGNDIEGVSWPGILNLINVPAETDLKKLSLSDYEESFQQCSKTSLRFQDSTTFEDRYLGIQVLRIMGETNCAIVISDRTAEHQSQKARSDFVALASHQLRTPLSAGIWNLDIFLNRYRKSLDKQQEHILDNVARSLSRMTHLIDALLSVSRLETGRLEVNPSPLEIRELIQKILDEVKPDADKKQIRMIVSLHQNLPKIVLDSSLIKYLFLNLIYNAIKYSDVGGEITLFLSRKDGVVLVQINNGGLTIPKSQQHKVFKRFFRAPQASKREPDGSGLGLYLSKMIVEKSGGTIWFESEPGKGTTFWFTLPLSDKIVQGK